MPVSVNGGFKMPSWYGKIEMTIDDYAFLT